MSRPFLEINSIHFLYWPYSICMTKINLGVQSHRFTKFGQTLKKTSSENNSFSLGVQNQITLQLHPLLGGSSKTFGNLLT